MTEKTKAEDFDLLGFVKGRSLAKDEVTLYMDEAAAKDVSDTLEYNKKGDPIGVLPDKDKDYKAAKKRLEASAITIHLEGAPEGKVQELREEYDIVQGGENDQDNEESWLVAVLEQQYRKTVSASGQETDTPLTTQEWFEFKSMVPLTQWRKLMNRVVELIYVSVVIDDSTDAGFLANS